MKKFSLKSVVIGLFCTLVAISLTAQTPPQLANVSKGLFAGKISVEWKYEYSKTTPDQVWFEVQRKTLVDPTKGKFGAWKPVKPKNPSKEGWYVVKKRENETKLIDGDGLTAWIWYAYQVKAIWQGGESSWSEEEYGFTKEASKLGTAILYEPKGGYQLTWSAVQGAKSYRLQIIERIPGQAYYHDPEKGFQQVPILEDVVLKEPFYNWVGTQKAILWSVQAINEQDSSYFPHPLQSEMRFGASSESYQLLKFVGLHQGSLSLLIQNPTEKVLTNLNVGIYLSKDPVFNPQSAILAKSIPIYLLPKKQVGFEETVQTAGFQYIHLVPVQSGVILNTEIETIQIR